MNMIKSQLILLLFLGLNSAIAFAKDESDLQAGSPFSNDAAQTNTIPIGSYTGNIAEIHYGDGTNHDVIWLKTSSPITGGFCSNTSWIRISTDNNADLAAFQLILEAFEAMSPVTISFATTCWLNTYERFGSFVVQ